MTSGLGFGGGGKGRRIYIESQGHHIFTSYAGVRLEWGFDGSTIWLFLMQSAEGRVFYQGEPNKQLICWVEGRCSVGTRNKDEEGRQHKRLNYS